MVWFAKVTWNGQLLNLCAFKHIRVAFFPFQLWWSCCGQTSIRPIVVYPRSLTPKPPWWRLHRLFLHFPLHPVHHVNSTGNVYILFLQCFFEWKGQNPSCKYVIAVLWEEFKLWHCSIQLFVLCNACPNFYLWTPLISEHPEDVRSRPLPCRHQTGWRVFRTSSTSCQVFINFCSELPTKKQQKDETLSCTLWEYDSLVVQLPIPVMTT